MADQGGAAASTHSSSCVAVHPEQLPDASVAITCTVPVPTVDTTTVDQQAMALEQLSTAERVPRPLPSTNLASPIQPVMPLTPSVQPSHSSPSSQTAISQLSEVEMDVLRLEATTEALNASGWYYEDLSSQEAHDALRSTSFGTFLVRDSSDPRFRFALSMQTELGPISIRLQYKTGLFCLDGNPRMVATLPHFECVVQLVEYYLRKIKDRRLKTETCYACHRKFNNNETLWVDTARGIVSDIQLTSPLYKKNQPFSLQHLARLAINKQMLKTKDGLAGIARLPLSVTHVDYLKVYPHTF